MNLEIWTEKYRPQKLDEIINQTHVVERLKAWVKDGSIPSMLFAGPAGVGKTCCAIAIAKELFGKYWKENFLEMNASDERGIDIVRGKIKNFARTKPIGADFRIIFLDESDALTPEAQQALRRTIERFSTVCRFILSANYSSRLIEPIQSRMSVFRFKNLGKEHVKEYMNRIIQSEELRISPDAIDTIHELSEGDLRKATNILQACSAAGKLITRDMVYEVVAKAKPEDIKNMLDYTLKGNFNDARKKLYDLLINQGLSGEDIIKEIHKQVFDLPIPESSKLKLIEKIGEFEFRLNMGGSEDIQLLAMLAQFLNVKKK
jgi:replication factor C small subunit